MFRIKICGITNSDDALAAAGAGADAIGLNFYSKSRRFVEPDHAREIAESVPAGVKKVGVFVNEDVKQIQRIASLVPLDAIQLHGNERASLIMSLPEDVPIILAVRCSPEGFSRLREIQSEIVARCLEGIAGSVLVRRRRNAGIFDATLVDANAGSDFGGSGELADWELICREKHETLATPLILAGGLTPQNVAIGIASVAPDGVDVASGVESSPGKKDPAKVHDFVAAAKEAFSRL
jgi:phosphoribosylanthranilate isomerase